MPEFRSGLVFRYSYLWARQHDDGEESGRKDRPVCVQMIVKASGGESLLLLFPMTSQPPGHETAALKIPPLEMRRAGLRADAWVIVDEWNEDDLATSPYLADPQPMGEFSKAFAAKIARAAATAIRSQRYRRVSRRPHSCRNETRVVRRGVCSPATPGKSTATGMTDASKPETTVVYPFAAAIDILGSQN